MTECPVCDGYTMRCAATDGTGCPEYYKKNKQMGANVGVLTDWRGTPIEPGCTIVYPGRKSSSLWVTEAVVIETGTQPSWRGVIPHLVVQITKSSGYFRTPRRVRLTSIDKVTVIPTSAELERRHPSCVDILCDNPDEHTHL